MPTEGTERSGCQGLIRAPFCLTAVIGGEVGMLIPHDATCTGLKTKFFIFSRGSNGQVLIILSYCHFDDGTNAPSTLFKVNSTTNFNHRFFLKTLSNLRFSFYSFCVFGVFSTELPTLPC